MKFENPPTINRLDLLSYLKGDKGTIIEKIWKYLLKQLPEKYKDEASKKGFKIEKSPFSKEDVKAQYLVFKVEGGTEELIKEIENIVPYIICLK